MVIVEKWSLRDQSVKKGKMTLIKSISGIRGTLENIPGSSLSDHDVEQFTLAYVKEVLSKEKTSNVIIGRDARISGIKISKIIKETLVREGVDVIDVGLVTTPTLGISVKHLNAAGGIMISASHNDEKWNALKFLNNKGEFLSPAKVALVIKDKNRDFKNPKKKGIISEYKYALRDHINLILSQKFLKINKLKNKKFSIAVDGINSVGGVAIPELLNRLGVDKIKKINCVVNGKFAHNPEPIPENIYEICDVIKKGKYDLGIVVDPDADRLCLVDENGKPFGEEYTLVAAAEYVLQKNKNTSTCSNLSSSLALKIVTEKHGGKYFSAPVGEINVVEKMKEVNAIIGGEGNGGVIYPNTHYGRDSLIGVAIVLSLLQERNITLSQLKDTLPLYYIVKNKMKFQGDITNIIMLLRKEYKSFKINTKDGVRIDFENSWVHIRKSNTEPVIRIISEADSKIKAEKISKEIISKLQIL